MEPFAASDVRARTIGLARKLIPEVLMYSGETPEPLVDLFDFVVPLVRFWMTSLTVGILILFSKWTVGAL
ncbi:hypothetical protein PN419_02725 [Halorubrum ezzemoulense]|uniref:hypothetical protein n=1 Tax=Halorubrum ezzemoulense TaxID=337243 RepID=UPI00232D75D6|nr:hypothetical protein [Halorubrum ezzemoulense]MDB9247926.1 hypothetical protein [Halorubrum ezzemoulense]MDB9258165.1 hypothetical protein [Halorubrum ezzemoulense]MDB9261473.1 hypothetical protein [Halorubrum ezzemoulense]MDB9264976.1 hypothetical protein [Halorubrum ezzemoulense]MDB9268526.1 hypothetical protein [Halorubrum ezzemoulense]